MSHAAAAAAAAAATAASRMPSLSENAPPDFLCPIGQSVMVDPVSTCDGHAYERSQIATWFSSGTRRSPLTNAPLASTTLTPNHALKKAIEHWKAQQAQQPQAQAQQPQAQLRQKDGIFLDAPSIVIAADKSGSMGTQLSRMMATGAGEVADSLKYLSVIDLAWKGIHYMLKCLVDTEGGVNVAIYVFNERVNEVMSLRALTAESIEEFERKSRFAFVPNGTTGTSAAMTVPLERTMKAAAAAGNRAPIHSMLFTDGQPTDPSGNFERPSRTTGHVAHWARMNICPTSSRHVTASVVCFGKDVIDARTMYELVVLANPQFFQRTEAVRAMQRVAELMRVSDSSADDGESRSTAHKILRKHCPAASSEMRRAFESDNMLTFCSDLVSLKDGRHSPRPFDTPGLFFISGPENLVTGIIEVLWRLKYGLEHNESMIQHLQRHADTATEDAPATTEPGATLPVREAVQRICNIMRAPPGGYCNRNHEPSQAQLADARKILDSLPEENMDEELKLALQWPNENRWRHWGEAYTHSLLVARKTGLATDAPLMQEGAKDLVAEAFGADNEDAIERYKEQKDALAAGASQAELPTTSLVARNNEARQYAAAQARQQAAAAQARHNAAPDYYTAPAPAPAPTIQRALTLDHFAQATQAVDRAQTCGACVYGKVPVLDEETKVIKEVDIDKLRQGDYILALTLGENNSDPTSAYAEVELVVCSGLKQQAQALHQSGDSDDHEHVAYITPNHPALDNETGCWLQGKRHPAFKGSARVSSTVGVDKVYSVMLRPVIVGGPRPTGFALATAPSRYVVVAALGHGRTDDEVLCHKLFGDAEAVLREVAKVGVVDGVAEVGPRTRSAWRRSAETGYVDRIVVDDANGKRAEPDRDADQDMTQADTDDDDDEQPRPAKLMCVGDDH